MGGEGGGKELLVDQRLGTVFGTQPPFLHDHLDLFGKLVVRQLEIDHAVGFERHDVGQARLVDLLKVAGVIARGKRIFAPSHGRHPPRKLTRRQ